MWRPALVSILTLTLSAAAHAQDETLIRGSSSYGGFGGPTFKMSRLAGKDVALAGGRGGVIIDDTWIIGGGGSGWGGTRFRGRDGATHELSVGYGGLDVEYISRSRRLVHTVLQLSVGSGEATQGTPGSHLSSDDSFFFAEPGVLVELNVAKFFRIGVGASYRFVSGAELPAFGNSDFGGAAATLSFRFGKFNSTAPAAHR